MKRKREFKCVSVVERLPGIINTYRGVVVYLPESEFSVRDRVRVTVVRQPAKRGPAFRTTYRTIAEGAKP